MTLQNGFDFRVGYIAGMRAAAEHCRQSDCPVPIEAWQGSPSKLTEATANMLADELDGMSERAEDRVVEAIKRAGHQRD